MESLAKLYRRYLLDFTIIQYGDTAEFSERISVEINGSNEKLGYKIREAQLEKVPFMLVVGENEQAPWL